MILSSKLLGGIPVETRSGKGLGKVASFDIDADTGRIKTFHVKSANLVSGLLGDELMIDWTQVVEVTEKRLVVTDATLPVGSRVLAKAPQTASSASLMEG